MTRIDFRQAIGLGRRYLAEQKLRDDMVQMLRDLEWALPSGREDGGKCPLCLRPEADGHRPACGLGKLLNRIDGA